ncbi:MAG: hypothetical protein QW220_00115 [Candidatus Bathyarchaeia archaeon]
MGRKFLAAKENLVEALSRLAKEKHLTLFSLVNESLEQTLRVEGFKKSLREVIDEYEALAIARETGFIIVMGEGLYSLIEKYYQEDRDGMIKVWYDQGSWYGRILPAQFLEKDGFNALEKFMRTIVWGLSEFTLSKIDNSLILRCIGPRLPESYTHLLAAFLEGLMHSLGYRTQSKDISRGIVFLTFTIGREGS